MLKKMNKKGFTLAELLIVVAIIGVLVAISIPIFTAQLKKARLATNQANARAAYAAVMAELITEDKSSGSATYDVAGAKLEGTAGSLIGTASAGDITEAIQNWTVDTPDDDLGLSTATKWYVNIASDGKATFTPTFPS